MELVAREPDIVTPTGIAVDEQARVWVIENNTHQRQADYKGPPSDRVRVFSDFDAAGRPRKVHTFAEGFRDSMGLALGKDKTVYLATRSDIYVLRADGKTVQKVTNAPEPSELATRPKGSVTVTLQNRLPVLRRKVWVVILSCCVGLD